MTRFLDILFSLIGLITLSPVFLVLMIVIPMDSRGTVFFIQSRVGKEGKDFRLIKFRSMIPGSKQNGNLTVGTRDARITNVGHFLRKFKLDEIPQLLNVLKGDMSLVGPRPEIRHFVEMYTEDQKKVLSVRPGMTDFASIEYICENELLGRSANP
ncbi:MAG: sugar transferase, partial [Bacteroidales bacterium]|nr:sugar transferase [Bacteroidales bacterium]